MSQSAIFRCDGGSGIGNGHVVRCLTLADALAAEGWSCAIACNPEAARSIPALARCGHKIHEIVTENGAAELKAWRPEGCELLIVDHYGLDAGYETACRPWARRIMVIDDLADRPHDCDILLDQTSGRQPGDYRDLAPNHCRRLLGTEFVLLRPQFCAARGDALARDRAKQPVQRVFVGMGGIDGRKLTPLVLEAIQRSGLDVAVDVVLGGRADSLAAVRAMVADFPLSIELHVDIDEVAPLMAAADLAVGAAGTGALERCCLGLPSLTVTVADNQRNNASALAAAVDNLGWWEEINADCVAQSLVALSADTDRRRAMGVAAATLCDGLGARRVAMAIAPEHATDGPVLRLRPAESSDRKILLDWQRDPRTRRHFRDPRAPSTEEHDLWFAARMDDPKLLLNIIEYDGSPAGVLRLDPMVDESGYEVSILVAPDLQARGIGRGALRLARRLLPDETLFAEVLPENAASHASFRGAGYVLSGRFYVNRAEIPMSKASQASA